MKLKYLLILSLLFFILTTTLSVYAQVATCKITYVANEGFLIETGNKKILVDALFGDKEYTYCEVPNPEIIESLKQQSFPFANIDLVAVTHSHSDHIYSPFVIEHLQSNSSTKLIAGEQTIKKIEATEGVDFIENQLLVVEPETLKFIDKTVNGIKIRAYLMSHGPYYDVDANTGEKVNRHANMHNIGFLFDIDGVKIFHCGDSSPLCFEDYEKLRLDKENIDIAFLGRGFLWNSKGKNIELIKNLIKPMRIIPMHMTEKDREHLRTIIPELDPGFPEVSMFDYKMESKNIFISR